MIERERERKTEREEKPIERTPPPPKKKTREKWELVRGGDIERGRECDKKKRTDGEKGRQTERDAGKDPLG